LAGFGGFIEDTDQLDRFGVLGKAGIIGMILGSYQSADQLELT